MTGPDYIPMERALIEEHQTHRFAYGLWNRVFGCWLAVNGEPTREVVPFWPVVDSAGALAADAEARRACRTVLHSIHPNDTLAVDWRSLWPEWLGAPGLPEPAVEALATVLSFIPERERRLAAPYGAWQWAVLDGIWRVPAFADFLAAEAEGFGPNYVIACFALANVHLLEARDRRILVHRLIRDKRRTILAALSRTPWSRSAVRGLRRFDPTAMSRIILMQYAQAMRDRRLARHLVHVRHLNGRIIQALPRLPDWMTHPDCLAALGAPGADDALWKLEELMRDHPNSGVTKERLRQSVMSGPRCLGDWASQWAHRLLADRSFPSPPVPGTPLLQPLTDGNALREEGMLMHNCIAQRLDDVADGTAYYYRWLGQERATVELRSAGNGAWVLGEHAGPENTLVSGRTTAEIQLIVARQVIAGYE